jgi:hypothetical protein
MANRVTVAEVKEILEIDISLTDQIITVFITTAHILVDKVCDTAELGTDLSKEVERWLSAHFVAIRDVKSSSESVSGGGGSVSVSYLSSVGMNLLQTTYGQQALILDVSGGLADLQDESMNGGKIVVSLKAMGPVDSNGE